MSNFRLHRATALLALCASVAAHAGVIGVAPSIAGGSVELHDTRATCVNSLRARWVSADQKDSVEGCWRPSGSAGLVNIVFMDVSVAQVPATAFTKPKEL